LHFLLPDRLAIHRLQTIKRLWKKKARDVSYVHASAVFDSFGLSAADMTDGQSFSFLNVRLIVYLLRLNHKESVRR